MSSIKVKLHYLKETKRTVVYEQHVTDETVLPAIQQVYINKAHLRPLMATETPGAWPKSVNIEVTL